MANYYLINIGNVCLQYNQLVHILKSTNQNKGMIMMVSSLLQWTNIAMLPSSDNFLKTLSIC